MSNPLVLVDSSIWIGYLSAGMARAAHTLDHLLDEHRVAINPVIRMEVLSGAATDTQYAELADRFNGLHLLPISDAIWKRAERMKFQLQRTGHTIPLPDVLIASCAIVYHCELLHLDKHFDAIARVAPLKISRPWY